MSEPSKRLSTTTKDKRETTRRTKAKAARKELSHNELRAKLKTVAYLTQLDKCAKEFTTIADQAAKAVNTNQAMTPMMVKTHELRLKALNSITALNLRRLNKVLPDLQAIALVQEAPESPLAALAAAIDSEATHGDSIEGEVDTCTPE